jgi:hypothetical protein
MNRLSLYAYLVSAILIVLSVFAFYIHLSGYQGTELVGSH